MKSNSVWSGSGSVVLAATMLTLANGAHGSVRVGGSSLWANGQVAQGYQYTGACPVALKFDWGVIGTEPTVVTYSFSRSDGATSSSPHYTNLQYANRSVPITDDWRLGDNTPQFANYSGWVQLNIESPNPVSYKIPFTIHCDGSVGASVRIGGSSLLANGQIAGGYQYNGPCPVDLEFHWGVIATAPTTVTYSYVRNDGGHLSTSRTIDLPYANRSVPIVEHWHLGNNLPQFSNYSGWVELEIESPNPVQYKIPFTLHCGDAGGASVRIGGWSFLANRQLARDYQYSGPCPVDLEFHWGVIGTAPATVTYSFIRNDGGHSSTPSTIDLPYANSSVPIVEHWHLGANTPQFFNYSGWVQLEIESPNPVQNKIPFTIHCM